MSEPADYVREQLADGVRVREALLADGVEPIVRAGECIAASLRAGGKLLLCGNGGSAADAQHIAAELVGRFARESRPGMPAVALTTDSSILTAVGNDLGFEQIFARQVEALGRPGDVLLAISTSGRSPNVLAAARKARELGLEVLALTGPAGSPLADLARETLAIPVADTQRIQELHITVGHLLCGLVENALFPAAP